MSFFKKQTSEEALKEGGDSKYISKSGLYDLNVITAFVGGTAKSPVVELYVDLNGQAQPLYGNMRLTNNDGSENFGAKVFNKLLVIADIDGVEDPIEGTLPIGKKQADKDVAILESIQDIDCKVHVQMEYSIYQGSIKEKTVIKNFYRADGASANEVVNDTEIGLDLEKSTKYFENVTYKDGLDAEQVNEWIAAKRPEGSAGTGSTTSAPTKRPSFGRKK